MIIYQYRVAHADLVANPNLVYVFGDNVARYGYAGQAAACRNKHNSHGIATLWEPGKYFDDRDYLKITAILVKDIDNLAERKANIVFPLDGIGTGLARMEEEYFRSRSGDAEELSRALAPPHAGVQARVGNVSR